MCIRSAFLACAVALCGCASPPQNTGNTNNDPITGTRTVLLIGNSSLGAFDEPGTADPLFPQDLTRSLQLVSEQAHGGASKFVTDRVLRAGVGCPDWAAESAQNAGSPLERAGSGDYDIVVLLIDIFETNRTRDEGCWNIFKDAAQGAGSQFLVMETATIADGYPAEFDAMHASVKSYAQDNQLVYAPTADVWRRVIGNATRDQLLEFYAGDAGHPGPEGMYLDTLTIYAALSNQRVSNAGIESDIPTLRCDPPDTPNLQPCVPASCFTESVDGIGADYADTDECFPNNNNLPNGRSFTNNRVIFVFPEEAVRYQATVDAAIAAR